MCETMYVQFQRNVPSSEESIQLLVPKGSLLHNISLIAALSFTFSFKTLFFKTACQDPVAIQKSHTFYALFTITFEQLKMLPTPLRTVDLKFNFDLCLQRSKCDYVSTVTAIKQILAFQSSYFILLVSFIVEAESTSQCTNHLQVMEAEETAKSVLAEGGVRGTPNSAIQLALLINYDKHKPNG